MEIAPPRSRIETLIEWIDRSPSWRSDSERRDLTLGITESADQAWRRCGRKRSLVFGGRARVFLDWRERQGSPRREDRWNESQRSRLKRETPDGACAPDAAAMVRLALVRLLVMRPMMCVVLRRSHFCKRGVVDRTRIRERGRLGHECECHRERGGEQSESYAGEHAEDNIIGMTSTGKR